MKPATYDKESLAAEIRRLRLQKKYSQEQLSKLCGFNSRYIHQIENLNKTPSLSGFITICKTLSVTPDTLLKSEFQSTKKL